MIGRRLSHFEITASLGSGGMGVVYKAVDLRLQRTVALKVLRADLGADAEQKGRFFREAQAASALNHPGIVTVHEVDSAEGVDFIAMEHVEGYALDEVGGGRPLPLAEALDYAVQIAEALSGAHAAGIVHRDLKPRNVIVTREGRVKVLDFGIAKRIGMGPPAGGGALLPTAELAPETQTGVVMGTPRYMSPEQAQGHKVDARSDIFSFGVLLYEMLGGRPPFTGDSLAGLVTAILRDTPAPLRKVRPDLPEDVDTIVGKMLEKDPGRRYPRMDDVRADLERLRRAPPPGTAVSLVPALPIGPRRGLRRALLTAAIVAVLGAVSFLVLRARRAGPSSFRFRLVAVPGAPRSPSFAPDGRMMAYVDEKEGVPQVWVKDLGEGTPVQVTSGTPPAARPRWSPRGDAIVLERRGQGIWAVPPLGGPPRQITDQGTCPAFFADGTRIAFARGDAIWTARLDGSEARPIEGVPTSYYASSYVRRCPAVSPDGREVAFFHPEAGPAGDLWLVPTAGGQARRLTFDSAEASAPSWTPDGRFLVFSSARRGSRTLWRVAAGGGEPEAVTTGAGDDLEPDVSAGQAILYTSTRITYRLMVLDPAHDRQRELLQRRAEINGAVFSPEGDRIAFFGLADRGLHLFTLRSDGSELRQVTRVDDERNVMPQWSRDASALYYYRQLPSPSFRKVPAAGGASTTVVDGWTWEQHNGARWDPEERRLAFTLLEAGRPKATLVREVAAASERPLERAIYSPRWSADGSHVVGNDWEGRILVCPAAGTPCHAVAEGRSASWSGDGARIYFQRPGRPLDVPGLRAVELWVVGRAGGEPRRVAVLEPQLSVATPAAISSRDEVAWVQVRRENPELWLAEPAR